MTKVADSRNLVAFEMQCHRRILKVCRQDRVTSKSVGEKVERQCTVMDLMRQKKLKLS